MAQAPSYPSRRVPPNHQLVMDKPQEVSWGSPIKGILKVTGYTVAAVAVLAGAAFVVDVLSQAVFGKMFAIDALKTAFHGLANLLQSGVGAVTGLFKTAEITTGGATALAAGAGGVVLASHMASASADVVLPSVALADHAGGHAHHLAEAAHHIEKGSWAERVGGRSPRMESFADQVMVDREAAIDTERSV